MQLMVTIYGKFHINMVKSAIQSNSQQNMH